ncbi:MAG: DUF134 domain-containing protein [Deltaproteobacteria bacterium]|nr:DUF134 domain-containing protein [Deltaproteobacteria bacterium]
MARKPQCRRIGGYPDCWIFSPEESSAEMPVILNLDEYESIRLIDHENLTQEQCAQCMGVARTTVTAIYDSARKKLAQVLVEGRTLRIGGGCYRIDNGKAEILLEKGENIMRIAVTYENGEIFQHFGHTEQFKLYDVEEGKIVHTQIVNTGECGHGALGGFLKVARVDALICGGIGMGAQNALAEAGIQLFGGVQGDADAAAQALAEGKLQYDPQAQCDHHGHSGHHGGSCHGGQSGRCH